MNADEALKLSKQAWLEKETKYLTYVTGYQAKVEEAAKEGKVRCAACLIPGSDPGLFDFVCAFFEQQGYWVSAQSSHSGEAIVVIDWHNEPTTSRIYRDSLRLTKSLE